MTGAAPSPDGSDCDQCGAEFHARSRTVVLVLAGNRKRHFCSDRCERQWLIATHDRWWHFLVRIYCLARGRARNIAKTALHTDTPP